MYRAPHDTFASTVERLETELRELRALRTTPRPPERALWMVTAVSVLCAVFAGTALVSAQASAEEANTRFEGLRQRVELKTDDLATCENVLTRALQ